MGDKTQKSWDECDEWQRDSAIAGVVSLAEDPTATPEKTHEWWMEHKKKDGWVYGEVKDAQKKTHPCMLPYSELPLEQKIKDHLFKTVVLTALSIKE